MTEAGAMTLDEQLLAAVEEVIFDPDTDPEVTADMACEAALNALDHLAVLAANGDTFQAIAANKIFVGQIFRKVNLVAALLLAKQQPCFGVVSNV